MQNKTKEQTCTKSDVTVKGWHLLYHYDHRESLTNKKDSQSEIVRIISYAF